MNREPASQVITCVQPGCVIRKLTSPATMLISAWDGPGKPTCDSCARFAFDHDTSGQLSLAPLSGYVDMFAAAKQVAFATPGQVIRGEAGPRRHWDTGEQVITPAPAPAPAPAPVPVARAGNGFTAEERARRRGRDPHAELRPPAARTWWIAAGAGLFGIVFCIGGAPDGTQIESPANGPLIAIGVTLILAGIIIAATAAIKIARIQQRRYLAWKATLTPQQRLAADIAEVAALAAGAYAVHEGLQHWGERTDARTATMRGHMEAARRLSDARDQRQQQEQMAASLAQLARQQQPVGPGPTRRSDIYGNFS
jgi:hypothetical protein